MTTLIISNAEIDDIMLVLKKKNHFWLKDWPLVYSSSTILDFVDFF